MTLANIPKPEPRMRPGSPPGLMSPQEPQAVPSRDRPMQGADRETEGAPHQDQDVGHDDTVALQAAGLVRLELEAAVLEEGHRVVVIEGDVALVSELPVGEEAGGSAAWEPGALGCLHRAWPPPPICPPAACPLQDAAPKPL